MFTTLKARDSYSTAQLSALVVLRVFIGWHFLYEGIAKMMMPDWSAASFLLESKWIFAKLFHAMAMNPVVLDAVNLMNMWGLTAIGLGLIVGCMTRTATLAGMAILVMYYACNPPLVGLTYSVPSEGSYIIINKNLVEFAALGVLFLFPNGHIIGFDRLLLGLKKTAGTVKKSEARS